MKMWKDSTIDQTKPVKITNTEADEFDADDEALRTATKDKQKQANTNNVTNIANNGEPVDQEGGVAQGISDIDDTDTEDKFYDPSKSTANDQQYKDVVVPQSVQDAYKEVLATKNAIKIDRFLKGLPANQAGSLRMNPPGTTTTTTPPNIGTAPVQPAVPQDGGELDINIEPEQDPKVTTKKPDELQVPDVPKQPESPKPDEIKPPNIGTPPDQPKSDTSTTTSPGELDIGVDEPVTTKEPSKLEVPVTDPEAGGPVNFIDPKTLSPSQKKELDNIAKRNQADQEKAAGTDAETRAQQAKDKLKQNQDKLDQVANQDNEVDTEIPSGITSPTQTSNMTGQQNNPNDTSTDTSTTQQIDPTTATNQSQADLAMGLTGPVATKTVQLKKGKTRQTNKDQEQTPRTKGLPGKQDDETDFKDMLRFNPAKYRDPLDLEKYKGGMQKQMGFTGGQS